MRKTLKFATIMVIGLIFISESLLAQTFRNYRSAASGIVMRYKVTGMSKLPAETRIGVIPFIHEDGSVSKFSRQFARKMNHSFDRSGGFTLVERARMNQIIEEMAKVAYGLADADQAARLGKLQEADAIVIGEFFEDGNFLKVSSRLVIVETAEIITSASIRVRLTPEIKKMIAEKEEVKITTEPPTPTSDQNQDQDQNQE